MISNLKLNQWILWALFVIAPFYFHANVGGTGLRIPNNIIIWFVASCFIFLSLICFSKSNKVSAPVNYLGVLAFPILAWFSSVLAGVEIVNAWAFRMLYLWAGVLFFFALFQQGYKQKHWDTLLFVILISGFIHSFAGILQIIFTTQLPSWVPINTSGIPTGFFQQINNQASYQVTVLMIALWLNTRPFLTNSKPLKLAFSLLAICTSSFIIAYSGSRIGILGFIVSLPLLILSRWAYIKNHYTKWLVILILIVSSISLANVMENKRGLSAVAEKTAAINAGYSASARLGIYSIALNLIKDKPFTGHGIGSFVRAWQYEKPDFYERHPNATLPNQRVSHPHNELMFWLVEAGILSAIGLLILLISTVVTIFKLPHCRRYAYLALLIPISLHTQVELPFYISSLHWFLFLTLLAFTLSYRVKTIPLSISMSARKALKIMAISLMILSTVFFLHSYKSSLEIKQYAVDKFGSTESMKNALINPYFKGMATNLVMLSMYKTSVIYDIDKNIELFSDWAEDTLPFDPHPLFFELIVKANLHLQKKEKACEFNTQAINMYPDNSQFKKIQHTCLELDNQNSN